jgi:putative membrane protein
MSAGFAFLHHVAAFALVAGIAIEWVLIRDANANARRLALTDMVVGISAGVLLVVGVLRVMYFEKGAAFYMSNTAFIAKMALFAAVALLSVYPTVKFLSWRRKTPDAASVAAIRRVLHLELAGVVLILLCAALMARGVGSFG